MSQAGMELPDSDPEYIAELKGCAERCNRVIKILEGDGGPSVREQLVRKLLPHFLELSLADCGCRVAQSLMEVLGPMEREEAMKQFRNKVRDLYTSRYANYVLAKVVEVLPPKNVDFIIDELAGSAASVARHRFGCRILERLIEHCPSDMIAGLVDEVVAEVEALSKHQFGNFVVKRLLEHGAEPCRDRLVQPLLPSLPALAKHRSASHVVQQALLCSDGERQTNMVHALLSSTSPTLIELACTRYGSYVVEELCGVHANITGVRGHLWEYREMLVGSEFGRRVAERFGFIERQSQLGSPDASASSDEGICGSGSPM